MSNQVNAKAGPSVVQNGTGTKKKVSKDKRRGYKEKMSKAAAEARQIEALNTEAMEYVRQSYLSC